MGLPKTSATKAAPRIPVVGYIRVSTDGQAEHGMGLEIQKDSIKKFIAEHPEYRLIRIYEDPGISGGSINRPGLRALLDAAKEKRFGKVIIAKLDRLARDLYIQLWIEKELLVDGIEVLSLAEGFNGKDPITIAMRQIVGVFAQLEKGRITERLTSGRLKKASLGGYAGGRPPRGYKTDDGKLRPNGEADMVRTLRKLHRQGWGFQKIARHFNSQNVPTCHGSRWYASSVRYIVLNAIYIGQIHYAGRATRGIHRPLEQAPTLK